MTAPLDTPPTGCLNCNRDAVTAYFAQLKIDPARFQLIPRPRHAWSDIVPCDQCGACWIASGPTESAPLDTPLPCPFCGRAPSAGHRTSDCTDSGEWHWIACYCGNCAATAHIGMPTAAEALAKWNRRAPVRDEAT
jgi:Lar family restriction alleviation protein